MPNTCQLQRRALMKMVTASCALGPLSATATVQPANISAYLDAVSEALIPGSLETSPGATILGRLEYTWLDVTVNDIALLRTRLDAFCNRPFEHLSGGEQAAQVTAFDRAAFAGSHGADLRQLWQKVKGVLLTSFFTSKKGASEMLSYNPVPGQWLPDIPVTQATPAMSNDWIAVWFT